MSPGPPQTSPAQPHPAQPSRPAGSPTHPPGPPVAPRPHPPAARRPVQVGAQAGKPGRRAKLTVRRIDPWSTLKFSFVYALAGLVVIVVAVVALYGIVDAMGVIDSIRTFLKDVENPKSGQGLAAWLTFGRVLTVTLVVGLINVILFTAFATVTAFIYNVSADLVGGVEVTLAERG